MCGFITLVGPPGTPVMADALETLTHRGPDAAGLWHSPSGRCAMGHRRLSILDLSAAGRQPMTSADGRYTIVFNGEIYNYLELRDQLGGAPIFRTGTDTEVLLAAFARWGADCLDRLIGMFAFAVWDEQEQQLFAARDRFGVKPLFLHETRDGTLLLASEIRALHAAGVPRVPDAATWATYLTSGLYDHGPDTFWHGVRRLLPGSCLTWTPGRPVVTQVWYDGAAAALAQELDRRDDAAVGEELLALLEQSVRLRFRADVPVGLCLSGGLDSSLLLALVRRLFGADASVRTFTFFCGDPAYDETPWVEQMLLHGRHEAHFCRLAPCDVPQLAAKVQSFQDEPYGGLPTLGMALVHERARAEGVTVLLDGNGLDEGWAGYDYYRRAVATDAAFGPVQGSTSRATDPDCLRPEFAALARPFAPSRPFGVPLLDLQYRDLAFAKIPRAMRFADRVSMMFSRELREPFLDHRVVEMGMRQPEERKIRGEQGKWLPRRVAARLLPDGIREAPKRPVQTPQREWLRSSLADWADACIEAGLAGWGGQWLDAAAVRAGWRQYRIVGGDNSFVIWQWLSLGLMGSA
jgi:asparagine synthase (glutamine-hydrolysing)